MLDAASDYLKQLQVLSRDYETQLAAIQKTEPSNPAGLTDRAQLGPRRVAIRKFLDSNEHLADYLRNSERIVTEQLQAHKVSAPAQAAFLSSFRQSDDRKQLVLKIRDTDKRIGESMLAMLLLLEQQWGDWTYESAAHRVLFQDGAALKRFEQINQDLSGAARKQQQLQHQLAKMPPPKGA